MTAAEWHEQKRAEKDARIAEYQVPHLVEHVKSRLERFAGDADMMFGIAVSTRVDFYRRHCGMTYPRASEAAIAITLHYTRGPRVA